MIISKKKFNEKIAQAVMEREKEMWLSERFARLEREIDERFEKLARTVMEIENRQAKGE